MMGKRQLVIDAADFVKGMSSDAEINDGGFSPESYGLNLKAVPGVVYAAAQAADADTDNRLSTTVSIIASAPDMATAMSDYRLLVGNNSSQDGTFYRYNGTKIIAAAYATDTTRNYEKGITDIITFGGEAYVTNFSTIVRWQHDNTITQDWHTFTTSTVPHPAIVFEDNAYYGDKNLLLRQTAANSAPATILTLPSHQIIVALGIDPGNGKMLISTVSTWDASDLGTGVNRVLWYDGYSNKVIKSMIVEERITAFHPHQGVIYVGYGQRLGYLTGSGIQFLRKLKNVDLDFDELPWKHNFASLNNTLYVVDGYQILAFGEIIRNQKAFYYAYYNYIGGSASTTNFSCVFDAGNNKIGFSEVETGEFYHLDVEATPTNLNNLLLYTNWYRFPRPVKNLSATMELLGQAASTNNFTISHQTQDGAAYANLSLAGGTITNTYTVPNLIGFGYSGSGREEYITALKLQISNTTENDGIRRIVIYYDYAE
jgi:hypothetical protein